MKIPRTVAAVAMFSLIAGNADAQCTKDIECRGDRICENGRCVNPPTQSGATKPKPSAGSSSNPTQVPKALEEALACTSKPNPGKAVLELQGSGAIESKASYTMDSINYFRVANPFEV